MKIRKATKKDIKQVFELGKKIDELNFSKEYPFHDLSELNEAVNSKRDIFIVAEEKNKIEGFLLGTIVFKRAGGWFMLDNIAVKKEERGRGIAGQLLETVYKILKKEKINYIQILEDTHHKSTRDFWKKRGYKERRKFIWAEKELK